MSAFIKSCEIGHIDEVNSFPLQTLSKDELHEGFIRAIKYGHLSVVISLIGFGKFTVNDGLLYACKFGNVHIVKHMLEKGADSCISGLINTCTSDNNEIATLMCDKITDIHVHVSLVIYTACSMGALKILRYILKHHVRFLGHWTSHLAAACRSSQFHIVKYITGNYRFDIDWDNHNLQDAMKDKPLVWRICLESGRNCFNKLTLKQLQGMLDIGMKLEWFNNNVARLPSNVQDFMPYLMEIALTRKEIIWETTNFPKVLIEIVCDY